MIKTFKKNRSLVLIVVIFTLTSTLMFLLLRQTANKVIAEQILHREQVVSRSGAQAIGLFINDLNQETQILSNNVSFVSDDKKALEKLLDDFVASYQPGPVSGVILTDKEGEVISNINRQKLPLETGVSLADRDYFIWAKTARPSETFFGKSVKSRIGASKSKYVLPIATPIIRNNQFDGVMTVGVIWEDLAKRYLDSLRFSEKTRVYLIKSDGTILYSVDKELWGVNFVDRVRVSGIKNSQATAEILLATLAANQESKLDIYLPDERTKKPDRFLIAATPINLRDKRWMLVIASPEIEARMFFGQFNKVHGLVLEWMLLMLISLMALVILYTRLIFRDAYEEGYSEGYYRCSRVRDRRKRKG